MKIGLTEAEKAARRTRLTGSSTAALLGWNPWQSPSAEWRRKIEGADDVLSEEAEVGLYLEQPIARLAQKRLRLGPMERPSSVLYAPEPELFVAHPDRLFPRHAVGLQAKNHRPHMARFFAGMPGSRGRWDNDIVPAYHLIQCMVEMLCVRSQRGSGWRRWILACFFGGGNLKLYEIAYDRRLAEALVLAGRTLWNRHLNPAGPQEPISDKHWPARLGESAPTPPVKKPRPEDWLYMPIPFFEEEKVRR